ncbi:MAG: thioredoxin domain-containing protein [Pirellulaceae bacterium]|nr:thioredoxin domain-containing protein [Pirellulaceae bacterium]
MERLVQKYHIRVKVIQFPLHPDTPQDGLSLDQLFAGRDIDVPAMNLAMQRRMAAESLPYGDRTMTFNSRLAQELAKWGESQPGGAAIHDALFRAYFVDGINIAIIDNLVALANRIGLDSDQATEVLRSRRMSKAVDADWQRARQLGVTGVPTFMVKDQVAVGAQPYEMLEKLINNADAK